jgi:recombination protein RecA
MTPPPSMAKFREALGKRYGDRLTPLKQMPPREIISTGSLTLDLAMRTGGWVRGRTHEIVGPPSACKTTLCILTAAEHQKATGKAVGWIDMEQSFDFEWAGSLGLDTSEEMFTHIYPDDAEDVSDMNKIMAQSDLYGLIVIDSIGGMESRKAFEKDAEESTMGRNAQVITRMVKQAASLARAKNITVIYVNQLRANLSYAGQDQPSGPRALQYNTTFSVRLARKGGSATDTTRKVKDGDVEDEVGRLFVAKVTRSRVSPSGRQAEFWLFNQATSEYGLIGIDKADEAVALGVRMGVVKQSGAFYTLPGDDKSIQGRAKLLAEVRKRPELMDTIRAEALKLVAHEVKEDDDE